MTRMAPKRTAAWASKKPSRCKNRVLYNNCPITCDSCPSMTPSAEPTSSTSTTLPCCGSLLGTMDDVERKINSMNLTISNMNLTINSMEMTINNMAQEMQEMKETMNTMLKYLVDAGGSSLGFYTVGYAFAWEETGPPTGARRSLGRRTSF